MICWCCLHDEDEPDNVEVDPSTGMCLYCQPCITCGVGGQLDSADNCDACGDGQVWGEAGRIAHARLAELQEARSSGPPR